MTRDSHLLNRFTAIPNIFQHSPLLPGEEVRDSLGKKGMLCDQSETEIFLFTNRIRFFLTEIHSVTFFLAKFMMF